MIKKYESKLFVQLSSVIDKFRLNQKSKNAQRLEMHKPDGSVFYEVSSIKEASLLCRKFINVFNLGSSNWRGGSIVDENYNFIAMVSYNGSVWDNENWKIAKEIEL